MLTVFFFFRSKDFSQAIRIKLISKDSLINGRQAEIRLVGIVERDVNENGDNNGNDSGLIRYVYDGIESTIPYFSTNLSNTSTLYCGDKVEFSLFSGNQFALNINLIERNRRRGWIGIIREGKGFIESNGETIAFSTSSFTGDNTQIELGDEVEFNLRKSTGRLTAENLVKVPLTIHNLYVMK